MASIRNGLTGILNKSKSDVVIVSALRTPICRANKGSFRDTYPEELLAHILSATRQRLSNLGVGPEIVEDIAVGTVLMELGGAKSGRLASLHAGFPYQTTFRTINRQCSSSLQALTDIASNIQSGNINCGIAAGTESMTKNYGTRAIPIDLSIDLQNSNNDHARDCLLPMGLTSEAVSELYKINRTSQDHFALKSHQKAQRAIESGWFDEEIIPIEINLRRNDSESISSYNQTLISKDEGVRFDLTIEQLSKLKPAFKSNGNSTAGNSSQISDGASAITLIRRDRAQELGLKPIAKFVGSNVIGVPPRLMGIGPAFSTPILLKRFGLEINDIDIIELNEAFASQALMTIQHLNLDESKVNPKGGAIALGHPLGATGIRLVSTLIHELIRTQKKIGIVSLCCGTGFGKSSLFVIE